MTDSSFETLRVYRSGTFQNVPLPDWYREANIISEMEDIDWADALDRVLATGAVPLTRDGGVGGSLDIRFWSGPEAGCFVVIQNSYAVIEMVLIPEPADWMPFVSSYLSPLMRADAQAAIADSLSTIKNALLAFLRHGKGNHISRYDGHSTIDRENDRARAARWRA